ncbi:MAG TPA: acyl-CoA dehydrogenase family protein [Xanthobacteraceae bacterium]|nr:acyl-CoA dehydrogenase family protein [Xanthobacteraceae bacterium]
MTLVETQDGNRRVPPRDDQAARDTSSQVYPLTKDLKRRAQAAAAVAAAHAAAVDAEARFPAEAFSAIRAQRLLGILVPVELGGEGARLSDVVDVCYVLGRACASAAMTYAMHQISVACLVRHARTSAWHTELLRRVCDRQLLLASSTTDGQGGGDLRKSDCAVVEHGARFALAKAATVMSYGAQADGIVTTARRSPDAAATDQVLVALLKEHYTLDRLSGWDTLGMRGTCSAGFKLEAAGQLAQVFPEPYQKIHAHTVMPVAHLAWSAVWTGIAASAVERARQFTRKAMRGNGGQLPPGAAHLTRASASLRVLQASVTSALQRYEAILAGDGEAEGLDFQTTLNLLKVNASEMSIAIVTSCLQACGLAGYRNDGDFSVARNLRDALSSSVMINNDRILGNVASAALLVEVPALLTD